MEKFFNVTGKCYKDKHYMVDITERVADEKVGGEPHYKKNEIILDYFIFFVIIFLWKSFSM